MLPCMVYVPLSTTFHPSVSLYFTVGSKCMKVFCQFMFHFECKVYRMNFTFEKHKMMNAMTLFTVNG